MHPYMDPPAARERTSIQAGRRMLIRPLSRAHAFGDLLVVPKKEIVQVDYDIQWFRAASRTMESMERIQMYWEEILAGREKEGDAVDLKPGVLLCPEDYRRLPLATTVYSAREPHMVLISCETKAGIDPYLAQIHDMKELGGLLARYNNDKKKKVREEGREKREIPPHLEISSFNRWFRLEHQMRLRNKDFAMMAECANGRDGFEDEGGFAFRDAEEAVLYSALGKRVQALSTKIFTGARLNMNHVITAPSSWEREVSIALNPEDERIGRISWLEAMGMGVGPLKQNPINNEEEQLGFLEYRLGLMRFISLQPKGGIKEGDRVQDRAANNEGTASPTIATANNNTHNNNGNRDGNSSDNNLDLREHRPITATWT
ncbi:hypothetical protein TrRE_jg13214 [Triparma retinervis]|uniref:Uncharacterized protein n=1 Tax=Triparma retinervis TaxID=2557542 RepID=A0A9W7FD18_9STRA|nr:hypothetical protein TrRE_jg13214 [Triparma retinervis]